MRNVSYEMALKSIEVGVVVVGIEVGVGSYLVVFAFSAELNKLLSRDESVDGCLWLSAQIDG